MDQGFKLWVQNEQYQSLQIPKINNIATPELFQTLGQNFAFIKKANSPLSLDFKQIYNELVKDPTLFFKSKKLAAQTSNKQKISFLC